MIKDKRNSLEASINKGISTNMDKKFIFMIYYLKIYYLLFRESAVG